MCITPPEETLNLYFPKIHAVVWGSNSSASGEGKLRHSGNRWSNHAVKVSVIVSSFPFLWSIHIAKRCVSATKSHILTFTSSYHLSSTPHCITARWIHLHLAVCFDASLPHLHHHLEDILDISTRTRSIPLKHLHPPSPTNLPAVKLILSLIRCN